MASEWALAERILVGFGVAYVLGFERELRGSIAGDRTFSLVGVACAAVTAVAFDRSPQAVAGVITGVGFVGGGLVFRQRGETLRGITGAAAVFAAAAIGIVAGAGHLGLAVLCGAICLLLLEIRHIPVLRILDARLYADRFPSDDVPGDPGEPSPDPPL